VQLTVCLLNWRRPENLHAIVEALRRQTCKPAIFLWNNSGLPFFHEGIDWQIDSDRNVGCSARWIMGAYATTECVASLDDDLLPGDDDLLQDAMDSLFRLGGPVGMAIGAFGVVLDPIADYSEAAHVSTPQKDTRVDIVKGRLLLTRTRDLLLALPSLFPGDGKPACEDDIALCGALAGGAHGYHHLPGIFRGRLVELDAGGVGLQDRPDHYDRREAVRREWFP